MRDMKAVLWGKLLLNLNNALVALSGLPLATRTRRSPLAADPGRPDRRGACGDEGLRHRAGADRRLAAGAAADVLRLPDWLFKLLARRMLAIDPQARSSMWDDLQRGRPTEIGELQGAVLGLAERTGTPAPLLKSVTALVRAAEAARLGSPGLAPEQVAPPGGSRSA